MKRAGIALVVMVGLAIIGTVIYFLFLKGKTDSMESSGGQEWDGTPEYDTTKWKVDTMVYSEGKSPLYSSPYENAIIIPPTTGEVGYYLGTTNGYATLSHISGKESRVYIKPLTRELEKTGFYQKI